jgi:hypothetical protein
MITVKITVNFDGQVLAKDIPNFPVNIDEAIEQYGADKVYEDFCRNMVIREQAKLRHDFRTTQAVLPGTTVADYMRATAKVPVKRKVTRKRKPVRKTKLKLVRKSPKK